MEIEEESIFPERRVVYAAFSGRLVAVIIDGLILLVPSIIINISLGDNRLLAYITNTIIAWLYEAIQISGPRQATIGKKIINIKISDLDGNRITFGQATVRYFAKIISALILFIGYFMMLWDKKSQTLHDKIAGTLAIVG